MRNYKPIYEAWSEEWTEALQKAGYDSIATLGLDGVEEYVLNPAKLIIFDSEPVAQGEVTFDV